MLTRRRILFAALLAIFAGLTATAWYVCTKGFTRSWRTLIAAEFEKQGIELSLRRLTLDPFRGLVAQEVKLLDARDRRRVLAVIDEMLIGVNYAGWARDESLLESVDLRDAHIVLPSLDSAHPERPVEITKLNARLFLPPQQIYLARAEGVILGLHVYASGRLINPQSFRSKPEDEKPLSEALRASLELISSMRFKADPPVFSVEFSGDLAKPEEIALDAHFYGQNIKHKSRNYTFEHLWAVASYRQGILELRQVGAADGKGEFRGAATFYPASGQFFARAVSSMAVQDAWRAYVPAPFPAWLQLTAAPKLDLTFEGFIGQPQDWSLLGHVDLERFLIDKTAYRALSADLSWRGDRWSLRDLHVQHATGEARGDVVALPGEFHAAAHGSIHPKAFAPLLSADFNEWLKRFDFTDSPTIDLELRGPSPALADCAGQGKIQFGRGLYDGAPAQNFSAALRISAGALSISPFRPPADGAEAQDLIFDLRTNEVRLEKKQTGALPPPSDHGKS